MVLFLIASSQAAELQPSLQLAHSQVRDLHQSPLPYATVGYGLDLGLGVPLGRFDGSIRIAGVLGSGQAEVDRPDITAGWIDAQADLGLTTPVWEGSSTFLHLGGHVSKRLEMLPGAALHVWALGTLGLGPHLALEHQAGRLRMKVDLTVPVVAAVSQHNWSLDPIVPGLGDVRAFYKVGTRARIVGQFLDVRTHAELAYPLSKRVDWTVDGHASWFSTSTPATVQRLGLGLTTGPSIHLGGAR